VEKNVNNPALSLGDAENRIWPCAKECSNEMDAVERWGRGKADVYVDLPISYGGNNPLAPDARAMFSFPRVFTRDWRLAGWRLLWLRWRVSLFCLCAGLISRP